MGKSKVDLTGQQFGRLQVLASAGFSTRGQLWSCRCECGQVKAILGSSLTSGNTRSCGCATGRFVDEVGNRYGRLTVLEYRGSKGRGARWLCRCDCGNEIECSGGSLRSKNSQSCGCLRDDRTREVCSLPSGVAGRNRAIQNIYANAQRRGIPWELTDDDVIALIEQPCYYCGVQAAHTSKARSGDYRHNGIDRVNNHLGYTKSNTVPCCITCNSAKRTMTQEEFLGWVARVFEHLHLQDMKG